MAARAASSAVNSPLLAPADIAALAERAAQAPLQLLRHAVHDHAAGDWHSARLGRGLDFEEARPYAPGDDVRDMDWRSTARLGHPFVKVYREERQPTWQIVLDRSATMRFGTRIRLKVAQAARVAMWLAFQADQQQVAVGASLWDRQGHALPARHGRAALGTLLSVLNAPCPPLAGQAPDAEHDRLRLLALVATLPRGSRVWLLSDFLWLRPSHLPALAQLADHLVLRPVRVLDAAEHGLPALGRVRMLDIACGRTAWVNTTQRLQREAFAQQQAAQHQAQDRLLQRCGLRAIDVASAADNFDQTLALHG